jgi:hypothetical protein
MDADDVEEEVAPITPKARSGTYTVDKKVLFVFDTETPHVIPRANKRHPHFPRVKIQQVEALLMPASEILFDTRHGHAPWLTMARECNVLSDHMHRALP